MRIGFNLFPYSKGRHGGAEVYITQVIHEVLAGEHAHEVVIFGEDEVLAQFSADRAPLRKVRIPRVLQRPRLVRIAAEQVAMPALALRHRLDCLISNYVVPAACPCPNVEVIHDMLYRRFPETMERSKRIFWSVMIPLTIRRSASIAAVSHFSAGEIAHFHPSAKGRLHVTVEGVRPSMARQQVRDRPGWLDERAYLLCVATFGKHKNLQLLFEAFGEAGDDLTDVQLVIVGAARTPDAQANKASLLALARARGVADRIVFSDHVTDGELAYLYENARALVFPSLYEGFGLPVIEAQHFNCPVVCSNRASLPEVAGDAALIFDPSRPEELAAAMKRVVAEPGLRDTLRTAGKRNLKRYSWKLAAEQLLAAAEAAVRR